MDSSDYHNHPAQQVYGSHGASSEKDVEKAPTHVQVAGIEGPPAEGQVHRALKARHLQMIALGGTIGTGLFLGSGGAYANGGPLGILLSYTFMGIGVWSMMVALGEMATLYPVSGAFVYYASRFVDPALAFALGWNYWYSYAITLPTELVAAANLIAWWPRGAEISPAVWIMTLLIVICGFNFLGVRVYGEAEFIFAIIKILMIIILIITGVIISSGATPAHDPIGFRYWNNPGPFQHLHGIPGSKGQFLAFWSTFVRSAFSFLGTEIVALTAAEARNPKRNVPKAIRRVFYRILLFYVCGVFVIGLCVDPNNPDLVNGHGASASPWVIAANEAQIKVLPHVINAVIISSAFSAGNSDLYASSRTLYGLAIDGKAPKIFAQVTRGGVPFWSLALTSLFGLLGLMTLSTTGTRAFDDLSSLSSITGLITWATILFSYIRFHRACKQQGIDRNTFPFKAPFQPYLSYAGFIFFVVIIIFSGFTVFLKDSWSTETFVVNYITVVLFVVLYGVWKVWKRTTLVPIHSIDFQAGRRELDEMAEEQEALEEQPTTFLGRMWAWIM